MKDFVTFEIAQKLNEKGFPSSECDEGYITEEYDVYNIGDRMETYMIPVDLPYIHESSF